MKASLLKRYAKNPVAFIDDFIKHNEKGKPWSLSPYQRRVLNLAFRWSLLGRLLFRILLWSEPKKSGKTFLAACLGLWWAITNPRTEVIVCANDLEQSVSRVFATMAALCNLNPALKECVTVRTASITLSNGTVITAIASDYRGAAGSRHSLVIFDELWGFSSENAQRLYEELTPPPTEPNAWVLVVSYAGFTNESKLLESMYQRGLAGERVDQELEVYRTCELTMFWSHMPRQPWQTSEYYEEQQRSLRPGTFLRLHRNQWVTAESIFITPELWDPCVDPGLLPALVSEAAVSIGVDCGIKSDSAAVVAVRWDGDKLALVSHRIWRPSQSNPLDIEATIETELRDLAQRHYLAAVYCDPYQLHRSITTLQAAGLPIQEFAQSVPNTTRMGQVLFDLLNGRNLRTYPSADLRAQALNTIAVETPRGWRIAKEKASKKIDAIVALCLACCCAMDKRPRTRELDMWTCGDSLLKRSVDEIQAAADAEFRAKREAAEQAVLDEIRRTGTAGGRWFS